MRQMYGPLHVLRHMPQAGAAADPVKFDGSRSR